MKKLRFLVVAVSIVALVPHIAKPGGVVNAGSSTLKAAAINASGHLVFTLSDGTTLDAGVMPAPSWRIPTGTPTATTAGTNGQQMIDSSYVYTFINGSWAKSTRLNLTPQ